MKLLFSREPFGSWTACGVRCARSAWVAMLLVVGSASSEAQNSDSLLRATVDAFGGGVVKLSSLAPKGAVVARYYVMPQQLCGAPKCSIKQVQLFAKNGSTLAPAGTVLTDTNVSGISAQLLINGAPQAVVDSGNTNTPAVETSSAIELQLIRDGRALVGGPFLGSSSSRTTSWRFYPVGGGSASYIYLEKSSVSVIAGSCRASGQTVTLPPARVDGFNGIGTTSRSRAFNIQLENCPPGFNQVGHVLSAIGGEVPGIRGALSPSAGSTASGVAIKLTDVSGAPATFGMSLPVTSYNKVTGGSASVPMHASYVQTGATVVPGTVKGAVQVLLDYQ
ncbi:MAG: fimbrial protein [Variovorax sp.]|nr:fimbrial protein [Variovorax sp.]